MKHKVIFLLICTLLLAACSQTTGEEAAATPEPNSASLPNPASVYCEEMGYELAIREGEDGTYGLCLFPDGTDCEEWAYFRGQCQPGDSLQSATEPNRLADDGCQVYQNEALGYTFHFPVNADIYFSDDPQRTLTIQGPLQDDEYWPIIYLSHPRDREDYSLPGEADLEQWLLDHMLMPPTDEPLAAETRLADTAIAGETAVHVRFNRSPQSYAYDKYFFAHAGQLYTLVILHTANREEWELYNHILESFQFES